MQADSSSWESFLSASEGDCRRHAQAQDAVGVGDVNPDFIDEGCPEVIGFHGFRRKLCRVGNVTDLARQGRVDAVDSDRCRLAFVIFPSLSSEM